MVRTGGAMSETNRKGWAATALVIALAGAMAMAAGPALGGSRAQKGKNTKAAETSVLVEDRGTLEYMVDGKPAGSEEFEIHLSGGQWTARGTAEVAGENGGTSKVTGKLTLTADGAPLRYEWTASSPPTPASIWSRRDGPGGSAKSGS